MIDNTMDTIHLHPHHITDIKELKINGENVSSIADLDNNIIYVAKNGSDETGNGSLGNPFLTIEYANNYAIANLPAWPRRLVISVAPGIYTEHITNSFYRVFIVGLGYTATEKDNPVTIRNTGADEATYPIACKEGLNLIGINVVTTDEDDEPITGIYGPLQKSPVFEACKFRNGYFINQMDATVGTIYQYMRNCYFIGGDAFRITGEMDDYRSLNFYSCVLDGATDTLFDGSCTSGSNSVKFDRCSITSKINVKGDWDVDLLWSEMYDPAKITFDTNGFINLYSTILDGGVHFYSDTPMTKKCVNCLFRNTPTGEGDMTADENIEFIEYTGNHQHNGVDGEVMTTNKMKTIGGGQNYYRNIHEALQSCNQDSIIDMWGDITVSSTLILPEYHKVTINGSKLWSIDVTCNNLVDIGDHQEITFTNVRKITGGKKCIINGTSTYPGLRFVNCGQTMAEPCYLNMEGNGYGTIFIEKSLIRGLSAPTIKINNTGIFMIIDKSFLAGGTGYPAIEWMVDTDNTFKSKYSTILHGSGGTNSPLLNSVGSGQIVLSMYNCALNAVFPTADFTNDIGNPNNTVDPQIFY